MGTPLAYYLIFAASGFSGLIYESIWTHYLKLFLGHAAYAQTLVLAIFMGGMALGAYICSRYSSRWHNLLGGYALAEGIIGVLALLYHPLFDAAINYSYTTVIPALHAQSAVTLYKWSISIASILPQSILLGMTFPLMSGAFLRFFPARSGSSLAILYFANSIGAVFGVLASGFIFIDLVGFPGTIGIAGVINILLAICVRFLSRTPPLAENAPPLQQQAQQPAAGSPSPFYRLFLLVSCGTGAASFAYEIGWIRMLSLVLGSSTHAFELMLGAFLLGLASGGYWVKKRIDTLANPVRFLAFVQLFMGMAALATLPLYNGTFPLMQWLVQSLPKTDAGYLLFNLSSYGISSVIMLPATFCAGMTLPLLTNILFHTGHGEKSIGAIYAANTVGAIAGIFVAVHVLMPMLGLKGLLISGAALDMILAVLLLACAADRATKRLVLPFAGACGVIVAAALFLVQLDPYKMASGIYRTGVRLMTPADATILFHKDGKTSTVTVVQEKNGLTSIRNNGKSDSAINLGSTGPYSTDESTTILLGALPFFYKPDARLIANIGLGTGLTTQAILTNPRVERVDTIEIERAVVEGARLFRSHTELVYSDQRSSILLDDAKSVFSSHGRTYDVIISEPSNPWVSGVASLFSEEFYRHVKRYLRDDGIFVQWIQLYEMDMNLVASVFKALAQNFPDYTVYLAGNNSDLVVVARKSGPLGPLKGDVFTTPALKEILAKIQVKGTEDIRIREVGSRKFLDPLFRTYPIRANSDYHPVLDQRAAKARFMGRGAADMLRLAAGPIPFMHLLTDDPALPPLSRVSIAAGCDMTILARRAAAMRDYIVTGRFPDDAAKDERILPDIVRQTAIGFRTMLTQGGNIDEAGRRELVSVAGVVMIPYLSSAEMQPVWSALARSPYRAKMSPLEKSFIEFFIALSRRDFRQTAALAGYLLANDPDLPANTRQYIIGTGMLASIAAGNRAAALELYQRDFGATMPSDILLRLLHAQTRP